MGAVNGLLKDYSKCLSADGLEQSLTLRNLNRVARRTVNRCWRDRALIERPRYFCQNIGGCGSTYIIRLLADNGIERCFHELEPDLNQLGIDHFENRIPRSRIVRLLRYTRHDVFFEANNRLFSFSRELKAAFPHAKFIHLHRHPAEAVRSAMSKPDVEAYLQSNLRFQGRLAGQKTARPFERFCHYWNNVNNRIAEDLAGQPVLSLRFADLVSGQIDSLAKFIDRALPNRKHEAVNRGRVRSEGRFPDYAAWAKTDQQTLHHICGATMKKLGY